MGLAWQQGPLAEASVGHFLTPQPMPERILYAEPLRRRMRVKFGDSYELRIGAPELVVLAGVVEVPLKLLRHYFNRI